MKPGDTVICVNDHASTTDNRKTSPKKLQEGKRYKIVSIIADGPAAPLCPMLTLEGVPFEWRSNRFAPVAMERILHRRKV